MAGPGHARHLKNNRTSCPGQIRKKEVAEWDSGYNPGKKPVKESDRVSVIEHYHFKICIKICYL